MRQRQLIRVFDVLMICCAEFSQCFLTLMRLRVLPFSYFPILRFETLSHVVLCAYNFHVKHVLIHITPSTHRHSSVDFVQPLLLEHLHRRTSNI
jgi:hypothetical protein